MSSDLVTQTSVGLAVPEIIGKAGKRAAWRFLEFFTVNIRKQEHTGSLCAIGRRFPALV